ncbi:MAG: FAD-dependent oxidoreductase [Alkalispirochaeta sp.]
MHILGRALSEGVVPAEDSIIIDPYPEPFAQWHRRVNNCRMRFLRSPASHGIARDYRTIRRTIRSREDFTPPYHRPSVELFADHLHQYRGETLAGTNQVQGMVHAILPAQDASGYRIEIAGTNAPRAVTADVVILAVGQPPVRIPPPLTSLPATAPLYHVHEDTSAIDHLTSSSAIAIVGGGIAAAHLSLALTERGHHITVWNRDRFTSYQFDSDPCFVGPRCASLFASIPDYRDRRALIQRSRRAGSVPPALFQEIRRTEQARRLRIIRGEVTRAALSGKRIVITGREQTVNASSGPRSAPRRSEEFDAVIACTGFTAGPPAADLIHQISRALSLRIAEDGYPIPSAELQWAPGVFVAGALGELELGPPARNLVGAHLAGRRILPALHRLFTAQRSN